MGTDFYAVLDQIFALLRSRRRVTYNALKLQFNLDDTHLAVLKEELLYTHPEVVDDAGRGLIWTSDESFLTSRHIVHSAMIRLYEDLVSALLQREGRVSYRTLTQLFGLDETSLDQVRQELIFKQLARDAHGEGLEWVGSRPSVVEVELELQCVVGNAPAATEQDEDPVEHGVKVSLHLPALLVSRYS